MTYLKKFLNQIYILFITGLFSCTAWVLTTPFILTPVAPANSLEIQMAYESSEHGKFAVRFDPNDQERELSFTFGNKGDEKTLNIPIPFTKADNFFLYFGPEGNLVRIAGIKINEKELSLDEVYQSLYDQGFKVGRLQGDSAVYLVSRGEKVYKFAFSNRMERITEKELTEILSADEMLSFSYLGILFFGILLLIIILLKLCKTPITINTVLYAISLIFLMFAIHGFCILIGYDYIIGIDEEPDHLLNFLKYESNLIPLILLIFLPALLALFIRIKLVKSVFFILSFALLFIIGLDNFVSSVFSARLQFRAAGDFVVDFTTAVPFFISYISSANGFIAICSAILLIFFFVRFFSSEINRKVIAGSYAFLFVISLVFTFWKFPSSVFDVYYANVFQVNQITTADFGNYQTPFSDDYPYRSQLDYQWQELPGQGRKQNVIVILVESLTCDLTQMCGTGADKELTPNLARIAKDSVFFDNYYSDAFSTSMAVLTVIKSFPSFPQRSSNDEYYGKEPYVKNLLEQNDLVNAFSKNAYRTSFFSSTDLVFLMDKNLALTSFDDVFDSDSDIFDKRDQKYIFHSVSDEILFDSILKYMEERNKTSHQSHRKLQIINDLGNTENVPERLFIMTKTVGSHVPFTSPWGSQNFDNSFLYTDYAISKFIKELEKRNYFDNGIVVLTGDHQPWGYVKNHNGESIFAQNHVPLIVIDKFQKPQVNHTQFSHSSLGVYLQSLMLDTYKLNKFNADPANSNRSALILAYEYGKQIFAMVKKDEKESRIKYNGDETEFVTKVFDDKMSQDILGYLASCSL